MKGNSRSQFSNAQLYVPQEQLEELLSNLGIATAGGTATDIIAYCPFHRNRDSPAFNISLTAPHLWRCHNGKCQKQGNILTLLVLKGYTKQEAVKMVVKGSYEINDLLALVERLMADTKTDIAKEDWVNIDVESFQRADERSGSPALMYLRSRGVSEAAYEYFRIGYSASKRMLVIPVMDESEHLVGVIGRSLDTKQYKYSTGLGRGQLVWNLHNAKRENDSIILTEGALDAIAIWQAGYKNVGAILGSAISPRQWKSIKKNFAEVICFFDNDEAGEGIREALLETVKDVSISYVTYPERLVTYTEVIDGDDVLKKRPIKDPGELTAEEIREMIETRKSNIEWLLSNQ